MRKITFFLFMVFCLTAATSYGRQVNPSEAQSIALSYIQQNSDRSLPGASPVSQQLELVMTAKSKSLDVDYYVFNKGVNDGYIIVSGDDRAAAVLGFSDEGTFDINNIPDGLQYWLEMYSQEMEYLRGNPNAPAAATRTKRSNQVRPLLTCNWNQGQPYNNLCPTYSDNGTTKRAVTGCVATAAAQIMYYHRWPITGTGSHSYVCNVNKTEEQTLSADFGSTTYDWDNMLDNYDGSYTDTQVSAVATLMYHVGVSCDMNYGSSSGAQTYAMMEALRNYFGYNKGMKDFKRGNTPIDEWEQMIMDELDNSRPVLYAGFTPTGGHAFVFDGYNYEGYFHVNWGWGGSSNGYFLVTALNPSDQGIGSFEGGYNSGQEIVTGICRDDNSTEPLDYIELICEEYKSSVSQVNLGESAPMTLTRFSVNGYGYYPTVDMKFGFNLTDLNNNSVDFSTDNCYYYRFKFGACYSFCEDYTPATNLANGQYRLWLMYMVPDAGMTEYVPYNHSNTTTGYINVTVQNGIMYFDEPETNDGILSLESLEVPAKVGTNSNFEVKATIANAGDEYYDNIYFVVKQQGTVVSTSDPIKIDVPMGDDVIIRSFVTAPATQGTYQLAVYDKKNQMIGQPVTLNVAESSNYSLSISSQLTTPSYYMEAYDIQASAEISNSGSGDYIGVIQMMITDEAVTRVKKLVSSPTVIIPAGGSATVNFQCEYGGNEGVVYKMCLRDVHYPDAYYIWGDIIAFEIKNYLMAIEDFEQIAVTTAPPADDVQGTLSTWKFVNCYVTSPSSDYCSGEHSTMMKKPASLTMTKDVRYVSNKISFDAYNAATSVAKFVLYCSTDQGATWTAVANSSGETTTSVAAGSNATLNFPLDIDVPARYRISMTAGATSYKAYIDNITIYYTDELPPEHIPSDVNGDGSVTTADITCLYNYLLNGDETFIATSDVNGDGEITTVDITIIYNILLGD